MHKLKIKKIVLGTLSTNCYIVSCLETKETIIIDPAADDTLILDEINQEKLIPRYIINTHGHGDHIGGNGLIKEKYSSKLLIHQLDHDMLLDSKKNLSLFVGIPVQSPPADGFIENNDVIRIGCVEVLVIHTPGHSPGSISLKVGQTVFTGDTLFKGSIGRTDLPGGSVQTILKSLREKLLVLGDHTLIYPGHGPSTVLMHERKNNPWLQN